MGEFARDDAREIVRQMVGRGVLPYDEAGLRLMRLADSDGPFLQELQDLYAQWQDEALWSLGGRDA